MPCTILTLGQGAPFVTAAAAMVATKLEALVFFLLLLLLLPLTLLLRRIRKTALTITDATKYNYFL